MSTFVDDAIQLYRAEELKLTENIRQYKGILRSMKMRVKVNSEAETPTSVKDHDISQKERQEVEFLEQVLKKALEIRSGSAVGLNYQENTSSSCSACKASAVKDSNQRNPQKPSLLPFEVKKSCQYAGLLKCTAGHRDVATHQALFKTGQSSQLTIKGKQSERRSNSDLDLKKQTEASVCKEHWMLSPSLPFWLTQRTKKQKLFNKVLTTQSKPVPERDHFKKRLISTFPTDWASVHIAAMEAELDAITQLGLDLTHCYNAELKNHQLGWSSEPLTEKEYETLLMLAKMKKMMVQVIKEASDLQKGEPIRWVSQTERKMLTDMQNNMVYNWERRMAWQHRALCSVQIRVGWHNLKYPCLSPILAYSSKDELEDLHIMRLHVALLKLEIHMYQAMYDTLLDPISGESFSSGRPSVTVLRGVYSLLGEGGTQFPSLVLDMDSAQT